MNGTPHHVAGIDELAVVEHRPAVADAGHPARPLHAGRGNVLRFRPHQCGRPAAIFFFRTL